LGITAAAVTICMIPYIGGWFGLSAESKQYFSSGMLISSFAFLLTGTAKLNVSCLNAVMQTKKAVFMTYIESLAVSPICLFLLPAVWDISGIWLALPVTAGIMTGIYGLIRKDRKNEE
jgi:Na+-driven multidrug efflux pump